MIEPDEGDAMRLTWRLKDEAWAEVAHLPLEQAFAERRRKSAATARELGLEHRIVDPRAAAIQTS